jgi:hypothetical protein
MGPMVGVGGLHVPSASVKRLERALDDLCERTGFPTGEEFKWSPQRGAWMRDGLVEDARREFFRTALALARSLGATTIAVAEDADRARARPESQTPEEDVVTMFLERAQSHLRATQTEAMLIFDRPAGGRKAESAFLAMCIETIGSGTAWVDFDHLTLALASDSKLVRLLQLADVVVGCTLSRVGGETPHSPPVFEAVRPLLRRDHVGRVGGFGLKLHPDLCFANLYHWLAGDREHWKQQVRYELPDARWPYATAPDRA